MQIFANIQLYAYKNKTEKGGKGEKIGEEDKQINKYKCLKDS